MLFLALIPLSVFARTADYMILEATWKPTRCLSHYCTESYKENEFSIHGMWPNALSGGHPANCLSYYMFDTAGVEKDLETYWMSDNGRNSKFWYHEWEKHGTCLSKPLTSPEYFQNTINAFLELNILSTLKSKDIEPGQKHIRTDTLKSSFSLEIIILCERGQTNSLKALRFCYDNDWKPINCPRSYSNCDGEFDLPMF